jgi:hypothetical protein
MLRGTTHSPARPGPGQVHEKTLFVEVIHFPDGGRMVANPEVIGCWWRSSPPVMQRKLAKL